MIPIMKYALKEMQLISSTWHWRFRCINNVTNVAREPRGNWSNVPPSVVSRPLYAVHLLALGVWFRILAATQRCKWTDSRLPFVSHNEVSRQWCLWYLALTRPSSLQLGSDKADLWQRKGVNDAIKVNYGGHIYKCVPVLHCFTCSLLLYPSLT